MTLQRLALCTMLGLVITGCVGPRTTPTPPDLPFSKEDPTGLRVRWRLFREGDQVHVDGLVTELSATPVKGAVLEVRGLDSQQRVVSWAWEVVKWSDASGSDRTRPFQMRIRPVGTEERFDVVVLQVDYYDWGG